MFNGLPLYIEPKSRSLVIYTLCHLSLRQNCKQHQGTNKVPQVVRTVITHYDNMETPHDNNTQKKIGLSNFFYVILKVSMTDELIGVKDLL